MGIWQFVGRERQSGSDGDATPVTSFTTRTASPSVAQVGSGARLRAVVIGNQNYAVANRLMNPISDARAISQVLRKQGFVATEMFDLASVDMRERLSAIYAEAAPRTRGITVRRDTTGPAVYFFFYSGHALTMDNQPCVVPVDVDMTNEASVRRYVVPFKDLLASSFGLVPRNQITLYSAAPGQVAFDGDGSRNSPFTESFTRHLQNPALDVATMFSYVTREVRRKTDDRQTPWVEGSLDSPLFLGDLGRTSLEGITLVSVLDSCRDAPFSPARK